MNKTNKIKKNKNSRKYNYIIRNLNTKTKKYKDIQAVSVVYDRFHSFEKVFSNKKAHQNDIERMKRNNTIYEFIEKPERIKPENDYYTYINQYWYKDYKLEKSHLYTPRINNYSLIQHKVFDQINELYNETINSAYVKESINMRTFYNSAYNLNTVKQSKENLHEIIEIIDKFRRDTLNNNLWKLLAYVNRNAMVSVRCPFRLHIMPDPKRTTIYCCHILPIEFNIDTSIFINDNKNVEYKKQYKKEYTEYLNGMFTECLGENSVNVEELLDIFKEISSCFQGNELTNDPNGNNKITTEESLTKYQFNFHEFAKESGFLEIPSFFITPNINYFKNMIKLLSKNWNTPKWRVFWLYIYIRQLCKFTRDWRGPTFKFYAKYLFGQQMFLKDDLFAINMTLIAYNKYLSNIYSERYNNPESFTYVNNLVTDIKNVLYRTIQNNTWLHSKTKKNALLMFEYLRVVIGNALDIPNDPDLNYTNNIWTNLSNYSLWRYKELISLNGQNVLNFPSVDWNTYPVKFVGYQNFIVNLYYEQKNNSLFIPLAYIQKPFIDLEEAGFEYNLAHIGFNLSRELIRSVCDAGSIYDYNGILNPWWEKQDVIEYEKIKDKIKDQYIAFAKKEKISLELDKYISENIYDIIGLQITNEYLMDFHEKKQLSYIIREIRAPDFYAFFANQMKQLLYNSRSSQISLLKNPDQIIKYRVNVALSRLELFRSIYHVKKGDGMYWKDIFNIF